MISQTAHFPGLTPKRLYDAFLPAEGHAAMTADGRQYVSYQRPDGGPADSPQNAAPSRASLTRTGILCTGNR
jgi:hypothetical protein